MEFYYEIGSRHALKVLAVIENSRQLNINLKDISTLQNRQAKNAHLYNTYLETPKGELFEPCAIIKYIARQNKLLYGENSFQRSLVDQWLNHYQTTLLTPLNQFYDIILSFTTVTRSRYHALNHQIKHVLEQIDAKLKMDSFLCGNYLTIADLCLACDLFLAFRLVFTERYKKSIPYLTKWYQRVTKKQQFQRVFGLDWPCKKELIPDIFIPEETNQPHTDTSIQQTSALDINTPMSLVANVNSPSLNSNAISFAVPDGEESISHSQYPDKQPPSMSKGAITAATTRNQIAYEYFKKLIRDSSSEEKNLKLSVFWNVADIMEISIYKIWLTKEASIADTNETEEENAEAGLKEKLESLVNYIKNVKSEEDLGWLGIYADKQEGMCIKGMWCMGSREPAEWFDKVLKTYGGEYRKMDLRNEKDREIVEEYWCKVQRDAWCLQQRVCLCVLVG